MDGDTLFSRVVLEVCTSSNVFVFSNKVDGIDATILSIGGTTTKFFFALRVGICDSKVCEDEVIDISGVDAIGNDIEVDGEGNGDGGGESVVACVGALDTVVVENGTIDWLHIDIVDSTCDD